MLIDAATARSEAPDGLIAGNGHLADACFAARPPGRAVSMPAGATLFLEGDDADSTCELVSGVVRLSKALSDGRRQIVGFIFPGQIFTSAGFAFGGGDRATCTADAVTAIEIVTYGRSGFDRLLAERSDLARALLAESGRRLFLAQQRMVLLGRMSAVERLAWFLLAMARQQGVTGDGFLHLPMTRLDIADYLGLSLETVSRTLSRLRAKRLIEARSAVTVRIVDWPRLTAVAEGLN